MTEILLLIVAMSMLITPLLFMIYDRLSTRMEDPAETMEADHIDDQAPIIIAGIGRFGQIVNRLVRSSGFRTVVLDHDLTTIQRMRRFGVKGFFGDPTRPELLHAAGLKEARVLVAALNNPDARHAPCRLCPARTPRHPDRCPRARPHPCLPALQGRRRSYRARGL